MKVSLSVLGAAKTESGYYIKYYIILFCNDWRMSQMNCVNETAEKQFPTLRLSEI